MKDNNWIEKLKEQNACSAGLAWASEQSSAQAAWDACERADWMLWAWGRNCGKQGSKSHRRIVLCAVECAKSSLKYIKDKEVKKLVKKSLETTERWAKGDKEVTLKDVKNAADAAYTARNSGAAAVWSAAGSSRYAANAVHAAYTAWSAAAAAAAADYAASAAWYDAINVAGAVRAETLKKCAVIIRKIQPDCPKFKRIVTG